MPILVILFALLVFAGGARYGYPVAGRETVTYQEQPGRFAVETLAALVGFGAIALFFWTDDPYLRSIALTVLVAALILRLGEILVRAARTGRIGATARAEQPGSFRARMAGVALLILVIGATLALAWRD